MKFYFLSAVLLQAVVSGKQPGITINLETIGYCEGANKDYINVDTLKLLPNFTSSGYIEIVQDIPRSASVDVFLHQMANQTWLKSNISIRNVEICKFMDQDMWFIPLARQVLNIPERCPIKKNKLVFKALVVHRRSQGIYPNGCFLVSLRMKDKNKIISCVQAVLKLSKYMKHRETTCPVP